MRGAVPLQRLMLSLLAQGESVSVSKCVCVRVRVHVCARACFDIYMS
jgi:hypothetical protein